VDEALWVTDASGALRAFDGRSNQVTATVELGRSAPDVAPVLLGGGGLVFAYRLDTGAVTLVDAATAQIVHRATVPPARPLVRNQLRYARGALWIAQPGRLWRVSPSGAATSSALPAGFAPSAIAGAGRWLWLADGNRLLRVDPTVPASTTERVLPDGVRQLLGNASGLFALGAGASDLRVLDRNTGAVVSAVRVTGHEKVLSMVDAGGSVWATGSCGDVLEVTGGPGARVRQAVRVSTVSQDLPAAASQDSLWAGDEAHSEVVRVSLGSGRILARIHIAAADPDDPAFSIVAGRTSVWVLDGNFADGVSRIDPITNRATRLVRATRGSSGLSAVVSAPPRTPRR
jgi:hypothetical protein